jgi:hypothetical protein
MSGKKQILKGLMDASITTKKADLATKQGKSDLSFNADISGWVASVNSKLDRDLSSAAIAGRSFHIVESPVFINPGVLEIGSTTYTDVSAGISGESIFHERVFRAYLKKQCDPAAHFVKGDVSLTEIVPPRPTISGVPRLPQNVMFRYRFSWES